MDQKPKLHNMNGTHVISFDMQFPDSLVEHSYGIQDKTTALVSKYLPSKAGTAEHYEVVPVMSASLEGALAKGKKYIKNYSQSHWPGGWGDLVAVIHWDNSYSKSDEYGEIEDEWQAVVSVGHSGS